MSEDSFRMLMFLVLMQERHWRVNYALERKAPEWVDIGGEA